MTTATETWTEQTIVVAGRKLRILKGGKGTPVVVLHHSTGNPGWLPLHEELARSFEVLVPDMPGYGQSERPEWAREPRDLAILVHQALDQLGLREVGLVGLGFGGFVAAEMASMNQGRLSRLVLVGAAGLQPDEGEILDEMLVDFEEYVKAGFRDDESYHTIFGEAASPEMKQLWDYSREMTARVSWKPYMFNRRLPFLLQEVRTPALVIWGSADRVVPVVCAQQYGRALPNARVEIINGAGHLVELEEPARVATLIAGHIQKR
jgi:pimeloyl-ACP methyl ester carboxylesterase